MTVPQSLQNIGVTSDDMYAAVVVGVLVLLTAAGGFIGEIGFWAMILLAVVAILAYYHGKGGSGQ